MEDKRREIKKSSPADFKKICGTEETLDSMVEVANTFNQVLNIYCGVLEEETMLVPNYHQYNIEFRAVINIESKIIKATDEFSLKRTHPLCYFFELSIYNDGINQALF